MRKQNIYFRHAALTKLALVVALAFVETWIFFLN
jgi:hypothetical protein